MTAQVIMLLYLLTFLTQKVHGAVIINGKNVPDGLMLYMVSVQNNKGHVCGRFLIREDYVITAAHCDKHNPTSVIIGTHNLKNIDDSTMRYSVTRCRHPDYVKVESGDDIMLLKLVGKVQFNNRVQPIPIPRTEVKLKDKAKCRVAGWGFTKTGGKISNGLKVADVSLMSLKECKNKWKFLKHSLPNNITCAAGPKLKAGFCKGDSGGPLICGGKAVGIVSFNMECDTYVPNVYTDVSKYVSWINGIVKQNHC
ncbi:granzyme B(G,H)-like [Cyprinodon tularosa]|uniref:granzyme B(G,H)-like n=1 Tax=Cyprinodon tularosa TaxID=77115 RepID=UPI0018E290B1|nr:granzyme B(G,H)-like [Cyprinodon tularosa]